MKQFLLPWYSADCFINVYNILSLINLIFSRLLWGVGKLAISLDSFVSISHVTYAEKNEITTELVIGGVSFFHTYSSRGYHKCDAVLINEA